MAFIEFKREKRDSDDPIISLSLSSGKFNYNSIICKLAGIGIKFHFVVYHVDDEDRKIAFEFKTEKDNPNCYPITGTSSKGISSTNIELSNKYLWLRKASELDDTEDRKYIALKTKNYWVIQLMPSFEVKSGLAEKNQIPKEAKGIYQYRDSENQIIYIGKGSILERLNSPERINWGIKTIEYSIITDEEKQFEWEYFWLSRFKERNNNRLPYYNKNSGISPSETI